MRTFQLWGGVTGPQPESGIQLADCRCRLSVGYWLAGPLGGIHDPNLGGGDQWNVTVKQLQLHLQ